MYALVEIKGKQYRVEKDATIRVDHIDSEAGTELEFPTVMLIGGDEKTMVGTPYVKGATVKAEVADQVRDRKVTVFKHKRRKNYRRTRGHRQQYSMLTIKEIVGG